MSSNEDFSDANVLFGTADVEETAATRLAAQTINLTTPVTARYVCIWQKGHYIQNTNSSWKGYSNGVGLREIEVIAKLKDGETLPDAQETCNIALGKLPYVYGLDPTNIAAISDGKQDDNYAVHNSTGERWLQFEYENRYRIHEVVLKLKPGTYPLVRIGVSSTPTSAGTDVDGMHSRPMFPIPETQVGDGWVGDVDYTKQATKQDGNLLVDWVRVYQSEGQPVTRFDDLDGAESGAYRIAPASRTEGLTAVSNGDAAWRNKNNFYYGGQPRYETSRLMRVADATGEQSLTYKVSGVRDVHLTAYYQTLADKTVSTSACSAGWSIRKSLVDGANIDFRVQTSTDGSAWQDFNGVKVVDNLIEVHPGYARTTFDAVGLPEGGGRTCVSCSRNSTGYAMRPRSGRGRWCRTPMCSSPRSRSCRSGARIRSRILTRIRILIRRRIPIQMTARAMAQIRFALRLRGPQTLCRIRTNAFTRSERPVAGKVVPPNRRNRAAP